MIINNRHQLMHVRNVIGFMVFLLYFSCGNAHGSNYYVDQIGSDSNSGSKDRPWRTIQRAANIAVAGDNIYVNNGVYSGFYSVSSGTAISPIIFKANANSVILNSRNSRTNDIVNIENTDYVTMDGFIVNNSGRAGIRVVNAWGVVIINNRVGPNTTWGIFTGFAPGIQIINNITFGSAQEHGIYVSNSTVPNDNPVIRGNESYGNNQNGIQINGDCRSGGDGVISGAVIENNKVHDNGHKGLSLISMPDSFVRNNLIYNNGTRGAGAGGIHLTDEPGCGMPSSRNVVVNNTVVEPRITGIRLSGGPINNVVFNNVIVSGTPIADEGGSNQIDRASNVTRRALTGLFLDPTKGDYHLTQDSPARYTGKHKYSNKEASMTDIEGNRRPAGHAFDSGAFEFRATSSATKSR